MVVALEATARGDAAHATVELPYGRGGVNESAGVAGSRRLVILNVPPHRFVVAPATVKRRRPQRPALLRQRHHSFERLRYPGTGVFFIFDFDYYWPASETAAVLLTAMVRSPSYKDERCRVRAERGRRTVAHGQ